MHVKNGDAISIPTENKLATWTEIIQTIQQLHVVFAGLESVLHLVAPQQRLASIDLYRYKLQVVMSHSVVMAVLGGVKAGKSTVFQSLCQNLEVARTGVEHLTQRPLAWSRSRLEPPNLTFADLFPEFAIETTADPVSATWLQEPPNRLWSMVHTAALPGVVLIDCPDLNSLNQINRTLAQQLAKACDVVFLVMLGGASAYSAEIKYFARDAVQMGRLLVPVLTKMDDEASARIVLDEFCREMAPLLAMPSFTLPYAFYVPNIAPEQRRNLANIRLRPLHHGEFLNLDQPAARIALKAQIWQTSYQHFQRQLKQELQVITTDCQAWLEHWQRLRQVLKEWSTQTAGAIFPRNIVLREIIEWYEDTKLNPVRKMLRRINPLNWPSQLYGLMRKWFLSQQERQELSTQAQQALEKLRFKIDASSNQTWVKIWGKGAPETAPGVARWFAEHPVNPTAFAALCQKLVRQSVVAPYFSKQWQLTFHRDLEEWWRSADESSRQKRHFLEYSQITLDLISWLALPATFFLPGSIDTIIVGVTQPILTFINNHFLFIESHFIGARKRWVESEGNRLLNEIIKNESNLVQFVQEIANWQKMHGILERLNAIFSKVNEKLNSILTGKSDLS